MPTCNARTNSLGQEIGGAISLTDLQPRTLGECYQSKYRAQDLKFKKISLKQAIYKYQSNNIQVICIYLQRKFDLTDESVIGIATKANKQYIQSQGKVYTARHGTIYDVEYEEEIDEQNN